MSGRPWPDFRPGPMGALAAWWRRRFARREEFTFEPPSSSHQQVFETPLPSAVYGLDFRARFTVHWRLDLTSGVRHNAPRSAAINDIVRRAKAVTERAMLVHHAALQHQLGDELAAERQVEGTHVWARAEGVELSADEADLEMARKHIELLRTTTVRQAERDAERAEIRYLRDEVLTDLSTATIWWLYRSGYQVEQAVALAPQLDQLVRIAAQRRDGHWAETLVTSFESALPRLTDGHRQDLRLHLAKALGIYGGPAVATEFAEQVGLPHQNGAKPLP
ncbi:hypothetical protein [Saccharothrix obliqua]|uniref:hypothetical protein n=1 Tax=Saccharothrix obliqua TaxID=2861747 RepID=UPI001C5FB09B|nr:hypothetical protein [Saccharothrix obliqua]MBW4719072.1 hypothetical protein [Saccharothrix obliqua]